jgi:glycosyltransferase involved in cell wall biosynthesis
MKDNQVPTVVIFTDWYVPGYKAGGPVQSVFNLAEILSKDFHVKVVSRNTDLNSNQAYHNVLSDQWVSIGNHHEVLYLSQGKLGFKIIKQIIKENTNNVILINGLYSFYFSFLPALLCISYPVRKVFIAVRGMLHTSALSVKPFKKQLFLTFARGLGLYQKPVMLATNAEEIEEIKKSLGRVKPVIAPNIPMVYQDLIPSGGKDDKLFTVAFIGRIAPEKNPLTLIEALHKIEIPMQVIFCGGSNNDSYLKSFKDQLSMLPAHIKYEYHSEMSHTDIQNLLSVTDVMALPSLGENFGHAIYESLVAGVPVIIGNNTPWKNLESKLSGIEIDPKDATSLKDAMLTFIKMDKVEFEQWRKGANKAAFDYYSSNNFRQIYLDLFS